MKITISIVFALVLTVTGYSAAYGAPANSQQVQIAKEAQQALQIRLQKLRVQNERLRVQNERKKRNQKLRALRLQLQKEMQKRAERLRIQKEKEKKNQMPKTGTQRSCTSSGSGKQATSPACGRPTIVNRPKP